MLSFYNSLYNAVFLQKDQHMTEVINQKPRSNDLAAVINTITKQSTDAANGTNTSEKASDSDRLSQIFNLLINMRSNKGSDQQQLVDAEMDKRTPLELPEEEDESSSSDDNSESEETETEESPEDEEDDLEKAMSPEAEQRTQALAEQLASKRPAKTATAAKVSAPKAPRPSRAKEQEAPLTHEQIQHFRDKYNVKAIMSKPDNVQKSEPNNTGDKEKEKTEKPANMKKLMHCLDVAKKFKDPTVAYAYEAGKTRVDQQKDGVGAVYGRETIETTEPVAKAESIRISATKTEKNPLPIKKK